jgi:hypothetical protein
MITVQRTDQDGSSRDPYSTEDREMAAAFVALAVQVADGPFLLQVTSDQWDIVPAWEQS